MMAETTATTEFIVAILGAGGISAVGAAIVTGYFSKRKLGAEATEIITKAAASVVVQLNGQLQRATQEVERANRSMERMRNEHRAERLADKDRHRGELQDIQSVLQLHVAWDQNATVELRKLGVELPPVPPLLPPRLMKG